MGIPLPALALQRPPQPDPLGEYGKIVALRSMLGQQRLQDLEAQQKELQVRDQQIVRQAFVANNGDLEKTIMDAAKGGASPQTLQGLQQHALQMKNLMATGDELQLKNMQTRSAMLAQRANAVLDAPQEQREKLYVGSIAELQ